MKKQILSEEIKRMQELAGVLKENESSDLTDKEKIYLESKLEEFLNNIKTKEDGI